jgi:hypothetical protein
MTIEDQLELEFCLIDGWLKDTTEPFDDWDWDGHELTLFLHNEPIEKYTRETLAEAIPGFPTTTTVEARKRVRSFNFSGQRYETRKPIPIHRGSVQSSHGRTAPGH